MSTATAELMVDTVRRYTAAELLELSDGAQFELVNGELRERSMSGESSAVASRLVWLLSVIVNEQNLGIVFGSDCSYQCFEDVTHDADRVRKPDVSFIRSGRLTQEQFQKGHIPVVPDLAVEVVSPNENANELEEKLEEYLSAGVKLVWVIHPRTQSVSVHRPEGSDSRLHATDELSGEGVVQGFRCRVGDLFVKVAST